MTVSRPISRRPLLLAWGLGLACLAVPLDPAAASSRRNGAFTCDEPHGGGRLERHCEIREMTLPGGGRLEVDAAPNGGIEVRGEKRSDVALRAKVVAQADTEDEARALAGQVHIETDGVVRATGPESRRGRSYWVSFELRVPEGAPLRLSTMNGGVSLEDVKGQVEFKTVNGGVRIDRAAGSLRGRTTNGGVEVALDGDSWQGEGLDVETTNGGVRVSVPSAYNARLVTGTVNGGLQVDFPVTVAGRIDKRLDVTLGRGGPTVRAITTNGGVVIRTR